MHMLCKTFLWAYRVLFVWNCCFRFAMAPRMDLSGMLTKYSMSLIKPADLNVPDTLNKVRSLNCLKVLIIHSVGLQKNKKHDLY